ncbi:GNAT family N-acetyltransferase [Flavobacterium difficile]|uniref:GNAT family N-acetyltransferase n=1 Tax=Flavobacterium difficile TaxID=2709659 RepID=A0ABX0I7A2_9FLAO|nr:GNAT family N-acetyltransferase [Flavobacterium difficile]NHM01375.1 GNAT family N-acetyltransferase [Flavobacterium difficile]
MNSYKIVKYASEHYVIWNEFVAKAKNATFLFHRDFMEYHSHKFEDFSLLIFDHKEKLRALLPANIFENNLYSHQGLTYGGLVLDENCKLSDVLQINYQLLKHLSEKGIEKLQLKIIPTIYNNLPSDEMEYVCFLLDANLIRRDAIAILDLSNKIEISRVRKRGIETGKKHQLKIKEEATFEAFWNELLLPNLKSKYNTNPVHSLKEITYLKSKFPNLIKQFNVYFEDKLVGGVTVFITKNVIHPQYIAGNAAFNTLYGGLDFLYQHLITTVFPNEKYFDFGISNENKGRNVNESLHYWKESFGARTIVQNFYEIETKNFDQLKSVLI